MRKTKYRKIAIYIGLFIISVGCFLVILYSQLFIVYPIKYSQYIEHYAVIYNLDSRLIYSIIKVESGYNENAISDANAYGLMQIKLATANDMVDDSEPKLTTNDLLIPEINIRYGCKYLRYLLDYYNGNTLNALCAYNAGLSNVNNWLNNEDYADDNGVLVTIPFNETNNYLIKVNKALKIYNMYYRWGKIQ